MTALLALLRGVNVGKAKRLPMEALRRIVQELGGREVATLLNSGNVVFRHAHALPHQLSVELCAAIQTQLDVAAAVVVRSSLQFDAALADDAFARHAQKPSMMLVAFAQSAQDLAALQSLAPLAASPGEWVVGRHAAYLHCPNGVLESRLAKALLGKAGHPVTTRSGATCLKLQALLHARAG